MKVMARIHRATTIPDTAAVLVWHWFGIGITLVWDYDIEMKRGGG
jgi:hypothetical protein